MIRKRTISSSRINNRRKQYETSKHFSLDNNNNFNFSHIKSQRFKNIDKVTPSNLSSNSIFSKNVNSPKKVSNNNFNILRLIIENNPNKFNYKKIRKKMKEISKIYSCYKNKSIQLPQSSKKYTDEVFFKYNVLYAHNTSNLIRTYSPKMRPMSSSINKFVKKMNTDKNENVFVFTDDEISELIKTKCGDIGIDVKDHMIFKFKDFCNSKCKNRYVDLTGNYLGLKSINFLGNILYNTDRISKLNLSKNNLGDIGVEILINSIKNSKSLIYLNISSNGITYKGGESIFKNIANHQSLIDFNICTIEGSNKNRNRLTSVGIKDIELYLKNNRLIEFLNICGNSIKNEGFILVCKGMNDNHSINSLNISHNEIEEKGIIQGLKCIKSSIKQLTFLDISKNNIMNEGVITLTNKLKFFPNLISLNISFCGFEFKGFRHLIKSLQYNRKIEKLNVSGNRIKSKNFDSIKDYFSFIGLKSLNMSKCHLCDDSILELGECLEQNFTIKKLNISDNELTDDGFRPFSQLFLKNLVLENFDCSSNFITDAGVRDFIKSLESNSSLKSINLYDNQLHSEIGNLIFEILQKNKTLISINLNYNRIPIKKIDEINKMLKINTQKQKLKYIPSLVRSVKELEFNPGQFEILTTKIKEKKNEQIYLFQKVKEEDNAYSSVINEKQKELDIKMNILYNMNSQIKALEKRINSIEREIDTEEKDFMVTESNLKDQIFEEKNKLNDVMSTYTYINQDYENIKKEINETYGLTKEKFNLSQKSLKKVQNSLTLIQKKLEEKKRIYQSLIDIKFIRNNYKKRKTYFHQNNNNNFYGRSRNTSFRTLRSKNNSPNLLLNTKTLNIEKEKKNNLFSSQKDSKKHKIKKKSNEKDVIRNKSLKKFIRMKSDSSALLYFSSHKNNNSNS